MTVQRPGFLQPPSVSVRVFFRFFFSVGCLLATAPPALASPGTCEGMGWYPELYLEARTGNCANDRSRCSGETFCTCQDGTGDRSPAIATCYDGCVYFDGETLPRIFRSVYASQQQIGPFGSSNNNNNIVIGGPVFHATLFGFTHSSEEGYIRYTYEPSPVNFLFPGFQKGCYATLDDRQCSCYQRFCNAEQTVYANVLDCSGVEGGAVIDLCLPPPAISAEGSSKMEILFWGPQLFCDDPSLLPQPPSEPVDDTNVPSEDPTTTTAPSGAPSEIPSEIPSDAPTTTVTTGSPTTLQSFCSNESESFPLGNGDTASCTDIARKKRKRNRLCNKSAYKENCPGLCRNRCGCVDYEHEFPRDKDTDRVLTCGEVRGWSRGKQQNQCQSNKVIAKNCPTVCDDECSEEEE